MCSHQLHTVRFASSKSPRRYAADLVATWLRVGGGEAYKKLGNFCCAGDMAATFSAKGVSNAFLTSPKPSERIWLIVLNYLVPPETRSIWSHAFERICADGGANRAFELFNGSSSTSVPSAPRPSEVYKPTIILGDLDSLSPTVRKHYEEQGVPCKDLSDDQDSTDLDKCLEYVKGRQAEMQQGGRHGKGEEDLVVVVGALGGRLDHTLGNLNSLYTHPHQNIVLVGEGNVVRLLQSGTTHLHVDREVEGKHCGVIPLCEPVTVTSKGLKWDMDELELKFGGMISACNHVDKSDIDITCSGPCLWITTTKEHG